MNKVVDDFGAEWSRFDQTAVDVDELRQIFNTYFEHFPLQDLSRSTGFDLGAGSGRWAKFVAPRVGTLYIVEPSRAIDVARKTLAEFDNCIFHATDVDGMNLPLCDFGYSLGVLHHVPDTEKALKKCVDALRPGAPFLLYLYYRFDNRPLWFRALWKCSDVVRKCVSRFPGALKFAVAEMIAATVYWPLARFSKLFNTQHFPLSQYADKSFYTMRTDALDRFGTSLEKRFTKAEMKEMMERCGLEHIQFSDKVFWVATGRKLK